MATLFGDDGAHVTGTSSFLNGYIYGLRFALSENCTATSLAARMYDDGDQQPFRICLYADGGSNAPTTLKGVTAEIAITDGDTAKDMRQADITPVELTAGNYFLCVWFSATSSGVGISKGANTGSSYGGYAAVAYHATNSPGNLSSWDALDIGTCRIICNYTADAAAHFQTTRRGIW